MYTESVEIAIKIPVNILSKTQKFVSNFSMAAHNTAARKVKVAFVFMEKVTFQ